MSSSDSKVKNYDICVIGSGGGAKISTPSSKLGYKVALCEFDRLGGTCLNRGCIPSKMLIHPADVAKNIDEAHRFDIVAKGYEVNFEQMVNRVAGVIDEESFSINPNIEANENIDWYREQVKFIGERTLQAGNTVFTADKIFIAAGARPYIPNIKGLDKVPYMTSTEALRHTKQPKHLAVIGGGYIACELAHYFNALGTKISIFVRSKMLRAEDGEVAEEFKRIFSKRKDLGVVHSSPKEVSFDEKSGMYTLTYEIDGKEEKVECDQLLVATGVIPNTDTLALDKAGVETFKKGAHNFIKVDGFLRTTSKNVWALGDIAGNFQFRHCANYEGEYLMETVIRKDELNDLTEEEKKMQEKEGQYYQIDYTGMPHAVFTNPQVAGVGETEEELIQRGVKYVKGVNKYSQSAMGMALRSEGGFAKLLIERETRKILGCHVIGDEASVMVHQIIPLMRLGGKLDDILYTIHIHPALNEIMKGAARRARNALVELGDNMPLKLKLK